MPAPRLSNRSPLAVTGWLLVAAVIAFRLLPGLVRPGMFFDGVTHAAIARNMAAGVGDFWHPVFSPADGAGYHEQPPLGFSLESLFFRTFGDHFWVEKLYSAVIAIATAAAIAAIWRQLAEERTELQSLDWLPVALWAAIPGWGWMYGNNMLENTLGLFTTLAVYAILRAATSRTAPSVAWLAAGGACVVAAVLSKGPVGLFPLATPLTIHLTLRRQPLPRSVCETTTLAAIVAAIFGLVLLNLAASNYLDKYLHEQLFASLAGRREVVDSALGRFDIIVKLLREAVVLAAIAGLIIIAALLGGYRRSPFKTTDRRIFAFCLLTAASASLPIIASPKQSGHYAFPSYSFYAMAFAIWCAPVVVYLFGDETETDDVGERRGATGQRSAAQRSRPAIGPGGRPARGKCRPNRTRKAIRWSSILCISGLIAVSISLAGRPLRDADVYRDTQTLGRLLPRASIVGLSNQLTEDYPLLTNLARWNFIGAERTIAGHEFIVAPANGAIPAGFSEIPARLSRYRLLERTTAVTQSASSEPASHKR
jgi:hypothetical protein